MRVSGRCRTTWTRRCLTRCVSRRTRTWRPCSCCRSPRPATSPWTGSRRSVRPAGRGAASNWQRTLATRSEQQQWGSRQQGQTSSSGGAGNKVRPAAVGEPATRSEQQQWGSRQQGQARTTAVGEPAGRPEQQQWRSRRVGQTSSSAGAGG